MAREDLHFRLRIPAELKEQVESAANNSKRSMTAEIVDRLQKSFDSWSRVELPEYLEERRRWATPDEVEMFNSQLNSAAYEIAANCFRSSSDYIKEMLVPFMVMIRDLDKLERDKYIETMHELLMGILEKTPEKERFVDAESLSSAIYAMGREN